MGPYFTLPSATFPVLIGSPSPSRAHLTCFLNNLQHILTRVFGMFIFLLKQAKEAAGAKVFQPEVTVAGNADGWFDIPQRGKKGGEKENDGKKKQPELTNTERQEIFKARMDSGNARLFTNDQIGEFQLLDSMKDYEAAKSAIDGVVIPKKGRSDASIGSFVHAKLDKERKQLDVNELLGQTYLELGRMMCEERISPVGGGMSDLTSNYRSSTVIDAEGFNYFVMWAGEESGVEGKSQAQLSKEWLQKSADCLKTAVDLSSASSDKDRVFTNKGFLGYAYTNLAKTYQSEGNALQKEGKVDEAKKCFGQAKELYAQANALIKDMLAIHVYIGGKFENVRLLTMIKNNESAIAEIGK